MLDDALFFEVEQFCVYTFWRMLKRIHLGGCAIGVTVSLMCNFTLTPFSWPIPWNNVGYKKQLLRAQLVLRCGVVLNMSDLYDENTKSRCCFVAEEGAMVTLQDVDW